MVIVKKKELKEMGASDLTKRLSELRLELSKNRSQIAVGGSVQNPGRVREIRKTIARMLTQIKMKKITGGSKTG